MAEVRPATRMLTVLRAAARALAVIAASLALCVVCIISSLNTPFTRKLVANTINRSLSGFFCGKVTVETIGSLRLSGIAGSRVRVEDPEGRHILLVDGLSARIAPLSAFR